MPEEGERRLASEPTLTDLVLAACAGDDWAFGQLWELLAPKVRGYALARGVPDPDDLTSEVFLQAFQALGGFRGDGDAFKRWLFTIAHRRCVDDVRRRSRHGHSEPYDADSDTRQSASAESLALQRLFGDQLRTTLACLTAEQCDVLVLRVLGELSLEEVAAATGRSLSATKSLQRRAVATLRSLSSSKEIFVSSDPNVAASAIAWMR